MDGLGADYTYRDAFDLVSTNLSPCGQDTVLNIQSDVRVSNSKNTKGSGYIATDSVSTRLHDMDHAHNNLIFLQIDTSLSTVSPSYRSHRPRTESNLRQTFNFQWQTCTK